MPIIRAEIASEDGDVGVLIAADPHSTDASKLCTADSLDEVNGAACRESAARQRTDSGSRAIASSTNGAAVAAVDVGDKVVEVLQSSVSSTSAGVPSCVDSSCEQLLKDVEPNVCSSAGSQLAVNSSQCRGTGASATVVDSPKDAEHKETTGRLSKLSLDDEEFLDAEDSFHAVAGYDGAVDGGKQLARCQLMDAIAAAGRAVKESSTPEASQAVEELAKQKIDSEPKKKRKKTRRPIKAKSKIGEDVCADSATVTGSSSPSPTAAVDVPEVAASAGDNKPSAAAPAVLAASGAGGSAAGDLSAAVPEAARDDSAAGRDGPETVSLAARKGSSAVKICQPPAGSGNRCVLNWYWRSDTALSAADSPTYLPPRLEFSEVMMKADVADVKWIPPPDIITSLLQSHILIKHSTKRKKAKYFCELCTLYLDTLADVKKHVSRNAHFLLVMDRRDVALRILPQPVPEHLSQLDLLLTSLYARSGLNAERRGRRASVANQMQHLLLPHFPNHDCEFEVFGSSLHGCGLDNAPVDMLLCVKNASDADFGSSQFLRSLEILRKSTDVVTDVCQELDCQQPYIKWRHTRSGLHLTLSLLTDWNRALTQLIAQYAAIDDRLVVLTAAFKHLAQVCDVESAARGYVPPAAFIVMVIYFLQQVQPPVLPVLHELAGDSKSDTYLSAEEALRTWQSQNTDGVGRLWLQLLHFYPSTFVGETRIASIRQRAPVSIGCKAWGNRKLAVEDPFQPKRNMTRSISSSAATDYVLKRLRSAAFYFRVPRDLQRGPLLQLQALASTSLIDVSDDLEARWAALKPNQLCFQFDKHAMGADQAAPEFCSLCHEEKHLSSSCPTLKLPSLVPLPPLSAVHTSLLDDTCAIVYQQSAPSGEVYRQRDRVVRDMQSWVRHEFPAAELNLFGSSRNGFGTADADLDICMTLGADTDPTTVDYEATIHRLARCLRRMPCLSNVSAIVSAKVPIVKFFDHQSGLEGDVSLYNTLALHNTLLLHTYASIDCRVRMLGYMLKLLAKRSEICHRSMGSLSSYAYILMTIYYLQRTSPPVIPVLQQLPTTGPRQLVEDRDVTFFRFSERSQLAKVWPQLDTNRATAGQLWFGLLRFYCETFDFENQVVSIRQLQPMVKLQKMWTSSSLAVEDPFLLNHNLAGGVGRKMSVFIRRCFMNWRQLHCMPLTRIPSQFNGAQECLLDPQLLSAGTPPVSKAGCWQCGAFAHRSYDCPQRQHEQRGGGGWRGRPSDSNPGRRNRPSDSQAGVRMNAGNRAGMHGGGGPSRQQQRAPAGSWRSGPGPQQQHVFYNSTRGDQLPPRPDDDGLLPLPAGFRGGDYRRARAGWRPPRSRR